MNSERMLLFLSLALLVAGTWAEPRRVCRPGETCRIDNIHQDSIFQPNPPEPVEINNGKSSVTLDCDFSAETLTIDVQAPTNILTQIVFDPAKLDVACPRNGKTQTLEKMLRNANFPQLRSKQFGFDELVAGINRTGTFEFSREVCIVQHEPHPTQINDFRSNHVRLRAACCLEPACLPHPLIIPVVEIEIGICKTDEWVMTADAGVPDRTSGITIAPKPGSPVADQDGIIQYVKRCIVSAPGSDPNVAIVDNGKLQHQNILQSTGTYNPGSRTFDFDFLTFVPATSTLPINWFTGNNQTCPLISCQFAYCSEDGSSGTRCQDFYKDTKAPVWDILSA